MLESPGTPWPANAGEYTAFSVRFSAGKGLDLTRPPLNRDAERWTHPTDYSHCQALADAAREADVLAIRYQSARALRDKRGATGVCGVCIAGASGAAGMADPRRRRWACVRSVSFQRNGSRSIALAFARDPRIATLTWER